MTSSLTNDILLRRSFVQIAAASSAVTALAQSSQPKDGAKPEFFAVEAGAGRPGKVIDMGRGRQILVKVSGDDTGGGFALVEVPALPNTGPALHLHHIENEFFYVLEGELDVQVGTEIRRLKPGGSAFLPRMVPHTWQPAGGQAVRFLSLAQPAGQLEAYLVDLSKLLQKGAADAAAIQALFERHGMEIKGPPLPSSP